MRVINRRTILISSNGAINAGNNNNINVGLNIPFIADEVIVKQVTFGIAASTGAVIHLVSNLVPDQYLAVIADVSTTQNLDNRFFINRTINGNYNFRAEAQTGGLSTSLGSYSMLLEFVQYAV